MKIENSYNIQIWVGLRAGYGEYYHTVEDVRKICDAWSNTLVDGLGDCVTITQTEFRYVNGWEAGVIVGFINYPRFPKDFIELTDRALKLAELLRVGLHQERVTVTTPRLSYLLEDELKSTNES
jgi:hypothetical protein